MATTLTPWREVVRPHEDVASGRYREAEFAADLWQVHLGEGAGGDRDPAAFFRRAFLTESLARRLAGAIRRRGGRGGDPVIQLETGFGGGKTHAMLALYHLFSGAPARDLAGVDAMLEAAAARALPAARRVVLVGDRISPGNPVVKADGTVVRTLWGELAWQLGLAAGGAAEARRAFARVRADDERATSPGDRLRGLLDDYGPTVVLIDEWVAYARQLPDAGDLPGGTLETQLSFAQALTESAKLAKRCLLAISLPAAEAARSPRAPEEDVEVGGARGREALERLRSVAGRLESSWRPASEAERVEIVRRRLFASMTEPAQLEARDAAARAFADLYRTEAQQLPPECRDAAYEQRLRAAYPIHPEVFDRLASDWAPLPRFQGTRGVLRLVAAVVHALWEAGDRGALIQPGDIPIDDARVRLELTRHLPERWPAVIEADVDGPASLPVRLDRDLPALGKLAACRRAARAVFLGSAPAASAASPGLDERRVKLGCARPGEPPAVHGDALRRLAAGATYLYQDSVRFWYATEPSVTRLAEDRAEQLKREPDRVAREVEARLRSDLERTGDFTRVHVLPRSGEDVADEPAACLVVLGLDRPAGKEPGNPAETAARAILAMRGPSPRIHRNALVFLAADRARLADLDEAARRFLAWSSILAGPAAPLELTPHQRRQAESQRASADGTLAARLPETYAWLVAPTQERPADAIGWQALRLTGTGPLAVRASKRLRGDELLVTAFHPARLRLELDRIPLWRGDHVRVAEVVDDFSRCVYLPRLRDPAVLLRAIEDGVRLPAWERDAFAYAEGFDEVAGRYLSLRAGEPVQASAEGRALLVRSAVAAAQRAREAGPGAASERSAGRPVTPPPAEPRPQGPSRYHATVALDPARLGAEARRIADEVLAHLAALPGATVKVTLEIDAQIPAGAPDPVVRTVGENGRTLGFAGRGFEAE